MHAPLLYARHLGARTVQVSIYTRKERMRRRGGFIYTIIDSRGARTSPDCAADLAAPTRRSYRALAGLLSERRIPNGASLSADTRRPVLRLSGRIDARGSDGQTRWNGSLLMTPGIVQVPQAHWCTAAGENMGVRGLASGGRR